MLKIQDAVDGVINAMRLRGCTESTLLHNRWSVYALIVNYHHKHGTDYCSDKLLERICKKQKNDMNKARSVHTARLAGITTGFDL